MDGSAVKVLRSTMRYLERARSLEPAYASGLQAARAPDLRRLARALGVRIQLFRFATAETAMAIPFQRGIYPVLINADKSSRVRLFGLRRELSRVLAREYFGIPILAGDGDASHRERIADLFALADTIPDRWIESARAAASPLRFEQEFRRRIWACEKNWSEARIHDRLHLRLLLEANTDR